MIVNPKFLTDGFTTLLGGVDESRAPLLLEPSQAARAVNLTFRGGYAKTRPGFKRAELTFARGSYGFWFRDHRYQGNEYYDTFDGMERIITMVGGRLFSITPSMGFMVDDITPRKTTVTTSGFTSDTSTTVTVMVDDYDTIFVGYPIYINNVEYFVTAKSGATLTLENSEELDGTAVAAGATVSYLDPNSPNSKHAWFVQAEQYMVIQDGSSPPIIYDGMSTRRAVPAKEIPTGTVMAYGQGRIWVAINDGREFAAGDIAGGPTGVLGFTENTYLAGGGSFRVPSNVGRIRAMKFVMNLDTSLGQGPLQVLTERAIFSVNAPTVRELWALVTNPIQTVSLINFGATSQFSTVLINGDLFFRSSDGLRSFIIARRDFGNWANTPVSREMSTLLDKDTPALLEYSSAVLFDNRLLFTVTPQPGLNGVRHKGLIALDFDLISTMRQRLPPAYDGIWTGIDVTGLVAGRFAQKTRCFAFTHDGEGANDFYEITQSEKFDNSNYPIDWQLETRAFSFPSIGLKRLAGIELWLGEFLDELDLTVQYKPDQHPCWQDWASKTVCVVSDECSDTSACASTAVSHMRGFKTRLSFGTPADEDGTGDEKAMRFGFNFQVRITGSGYALLNRAHVIAHAEEEWPIAPPPDDRSECAEITCCPPDPFGYVTRCAKPLAPLLYNQTVSFSFGWRLGFSFDPDTTYTLWASTVEDGEHEIVDFPNDIFEDWPNPDGWYEFNVIDIFGDLPNLAEGDVVTFWMVQEGCGGTRTSKSVMITYTG